MANKESLKEIKTNQNTISVSEFCDIKSLSDLDSITLKRHYKDVQMTEQNWINELKNSITINK